jgi:hypothetical protein
MTDGATWPAFTGYLLTGIDYPGQTEIGGVSKNGGQECAFVRAYLTGPSLDPSWPPPFQR